MAYRNIGHFLIGKKIMFSQETLIKIFEDKEVKRIPTIYQFIMIHVIERVLEENKTDKK